MTEAAAGDLRSLAASLAEDAARHDRDGSFPFANLARLRRAGLLRLTVPVAFGGQGAGLEAVEIPADHAIDLRPLGRPGPPERDVGCAAVPVPTADAAHLAAGRAALSPIADIRSA